LRSPGRRYTSCSTNWTPTITGRWRWRSTSRSASRALLLIRDVLSRIWEVKKHRIPDPTYFCIKAINKFC
jgi:hypothetical protein